MATISGPSLGSKYPTGPMPHAPVLRIRLRLIWMLTRLPAATIRLPGWPGLVAGICNVIVVSQGPGNFYRCPTDSAVLFPFGVRVSPSSLE